MIRKHEKKLQCSLLLLAIFGILYGNVREETTLVLKKAINICLECIGIG